MSGLLLWDFDGTLAIRRGETGWSVLLVEVLDTHDPGHGLDADAIRPHLRDGFPWHTPHVPHPHLCSAVAWWEMAEHRLACAYEAVGYGARRASDLARRAHRLYIDHRVGWAVYDDVVPVLTRLAERGWTHRILSNHVPELGALVDGLGLGDLVDSVSSSAETGYEKPHPQAFASVLDGHGRERTWMIGDNFSADVTGAEAAGLSAVLVRREHKEATRFSVDLWGVEPFLEVV